MMARILTAAEKSKFQETVSWLMHEHKLDEAKAWATATDPAKALAFIRSPAIKNEAARCEAMKTVKLSESQAAVVRMKSSDNARSLPGSSISVIRPTPGVPATTRPAERKPGETLGDFQKRLRQQILDLGLPANQARPLASSNDSASYAEIRATLLASEPAKVRELTRHQGRVQAAPSTDALTAEAHALMKSRRQSIDPKSASFSENFKRALGEVAKQ